ncbi:uncharacterized protein BCR38DRAFT_405131 [Pseudomassariella vexata]|uniref:Cytochrome P450 n=1 Tax=Pseudomassariella vexata TaxID=1141098 RepID=A0A1Y2EKS6_9PEZI|nr:uncharacterized protein BCR38DRAFT_405131 [Pseudomassariella vexata]ORY72131.1 hypothetical protein BCR38DRAFT_405131 [Pseudomassariella vexata]
MSSSNPVNHLHDIILTPTAMTTAALFTGAIVVLIYLLYQCSLPKPIPGIPHNQTSLDSPLGDFPKMLQYMHEMGNSLCFCFSSHVQKHNSPITQILIRPFTRPMVLLADFRFLHRVAGPAIDVNASRLIELWKVKSGMAAGSPFSANVDVYQAALDAVFGFAFGKDFPHSATRPKLELLKGLDAESVERIRRKGEKGDDEPIEFSGAETDEVITATLDLAIMLGTGPSLLSPAIDIPEDLRRETSQLAKKEGKGRAWDPEDIGVFKPERWLVSAPKGHREQSGFEVEFDAAAGPQLSFSLGTRGYFGKRLAYLELRILITLIVWNFELLPCPKELSSYNSTLGITNKPNQCYVRLRKVDHTL